MKTLLFAAMLLQCIHLSAQNNNRTRNNALSFEIGKSGLILNASFDHRFGAKPFGARLSAGHNVGSSTSFAIIEPGFYWLFGKSKRYLELGANIGYMSINDNIPEGGQGDDQIGFGDLIGDLVYPNEDMRSLYTSVNIGYRSYSNKALFRIGVSPGIAGGKFIPGGYVSIGARF